MAIHTVSRKRRSHVARGHPRPIALQRAGDARWFLGRAEHDQGVRGDDRGACRRNRELGSARARAAVARSSRRGRMVLCALGRADVLDRRPGHDCRRGLVRVRPPRRAAHLHRELGRGALPARRRTCGVRALSPRALRARPGERPSSRIRRAPGPSGDDGCRGRVRDRNPRPTRHPRLILTRLPGTARGPSTWRRRRGSRTSRARARPWPRAGTPRARCARSPCRG